MIVRSRGSAGSQARTSAAGRLVSSTWRGSTGRAPGIRLCTAGWTKGDVTSRTSARPDSILSRAATRPIRNSLMQAETRPRPRLFLDHMFGEVIARAPADAEPLHDSLEVLVWLRSHD